MSLLRVESLTKSFGGFVALNKVSVAVEPGERLGLIGPNGSGKTTLINCISGVLYCDDGRIEFDGRDVTREPPHKRAHAGIARSFQIPKPFRSMTVLDNLRVPLEYAARDRADGRAPVEEAMHMLASMGLAARAHDESSSLTQVDMRKLELARALAAKPRLLISDEAMAGLSAAEIDDVLANPVPAQRVGHHGDHDRAHHAGGDAVLAARDLPRRRPGHLRGDAGGNRRGYQRPEGLPWRLD